MKERIICPPLARRRYIVALVLLLSACSVPSTATPNLPTLASTPTYISTAVLPTPTPTTAATATPAFALQKLVGIWKVKDVYVRMTANGKFGVVEGEGRGIAGFIGSPLEGTWVVEGDRIKFYDEPHCAPTDVGIYNITFSKMGERHTLTLVNDPCEWRKGGPVRAASTYRKLEPKVLPGIYLSEVKQAEAEAAGGGDLLNLVGAWELRLNPDDTFELLRNDETVTQGKYLSAELEFTLDHHNLCPSADLSVYSVISEEAGVTFDQIKSASRTYDCPAMVLILTRHAWVKK